MASFTPGRPRLALGIGIAALVLGVALIPVAIAHARGDYGVHFWWLVAAPVVGGLYFTITGALALSHGDRGQGRGDDDGPR